jgi:hypothetical protein
MKTGSPIAIRVVTIAGLSWLLVCEAGCKIARLPLYGLYLGSLASGEPGYKPMVMHGFALACAFVFGGLLLFPYAQRSTRALRIFVALFVISSAIGLLRLFYTFRNVW